MGDVEVQQQRDEDRRLRVDVDVGRRSRSAGGCWWPRPGPAARRRRAASARVRPARGRGRRRRAAFAADDALDEAVQQVRESEQGTLTQQIDPAVRQDASPHGGEASAHRELIVSTRSGWREKFRDELDDVRAVEPRPVPGVLEQPRPRSLRRAPARTARRRARGCRGRARPTRSAPAHRVRRGRHRRRRGCPRRRCGSSLQDRALGAEVEPHIELAAARARAIGSAFAPRSTRRSRRGVRHAHRQLAEHRRAPDSRRRGATA